MAGKDRFNLFRKKIDAPVHDHVFLPSFNGQEPVLINLAHIMDRCPPVFIPYPFNRPVFLFIVAIDQEWTPDMDLPDLIRRGDDPSAAITDFDFHMPARLSDSRGLGLSVSTR